MWVSSNGGKTIRLHVLAGGLLTKNRDIVVECTETLAELKDQISQRLGLEGVKDFDILATDQKTKESNVVIEDPTRDLRDGLVLMLQDNQDFSTT